MIEDESPTHDASCENVNPPSHMGPKKPSGQEHREQAASFTPPFWQLSVQVLHVGPVIPRLLHWHVQSLSVTAPGPQLAAGQAVGARGFTTPRPERDSMVHVSDPRRILKKPFSPNEAPHEFWQSQ